MAGVYNPLETQDGILNNNINKMDNENNAGKDNSGDRNSGYWNSGDWNSGYWNSGNGNSGDWNSGDRNSGYWNSGDWNSGYWNSGNGNSGDWNSGDRNSGGWNSGDRNSGGWNSGYGNSGYLNTDEPLVRIFNKETSIQRNDIDFPDFFYDVNTNIWITSREMTDQEKINNPNFYTTGGYLKTIDYKEAWRIAWDNADVDDKKKCLQLPNWSNEIFKEITGIDVEKELNARKHKITLDGKEIEISEERYQEFKKQFRD